MEEEIKTGGWRKNKIKGLLVNKRVNMNSGNSGPAYDDGSDLFTTPTHPVLTGGYVCRLVY